MTNDKSAAPQPVADREALVEVIRKAFKGHGWLPADLPDDTADALIADGWRKPTNAQPETLAWAVVAEDGKVVPASCGFVKEYAATRIAHPWDRLVRVVIRVVDDEEKS